MPSKALGLALALASAALPAARAGTIWWLSDMHVDVHGDSVPSKPTCAWTPPSLFSSCLDLMAREQPKPDFIVITGDFVHFPERNATDLSAANVVATIQSVTDWVSHTFPDVPVLPCLGNHDFSPSNNWPDEERAQWLYQPLAKMWAHWLPASALVTIGKQGSYSAVYPNRGGSGHDLRVIAPNTNYWAWYNTFATWDTGPAERHWTWFAGEVEAAAAAGQRIWIVGHHPPVGQDSGFAVDDLWPMYSLRYSTLLQKHKELVRAQWFGHEHYNEFRLIRECTFTEANAGSSGVNNCAGTPWGVTYISQCMSNCRDPGVRLWTYGDEEWDMVDYNQYGKAIGSGPEGNWTLRYNFKDVYGADMKDMSAVSFQAEVDRLAGDDTRFKAFMKRRMEDSTGSGSDECDDMCKRFQLCNMSFGNLAEFLQCVYRGYTAMADRALTSQAHAIESGGFGVQVSANGKSSVRLASDIYN